MNSLLLVVISLFGYILAYRFYGHYLGKKIFEISTGNIMPSHEFEDGVDFVPSRKNIIFGHHFTTIAGLGPIVGPAIGIIWGWLPAFLWIFLGSVFMGAVHDFSTMIVSARNKGISIGDLTGKLISPSTGYAFQFIMQFLLFVVLSVFAMIVSTLFIMYPESVIPIWLQIPIALWLGRKISQGKNETFYSIIAVIVMYLSIIAGVNFPVSLPGSNENMIIVSWCIILFIYVFIASTLPVQKLLQPRDYINSQQLLIAMALMLIGIIVAHPVISAPAINHQAFSTSSSVPSMMPALFIIIACGAISGFHSLAGSGTTIKQVDKEKDTLFIGFGGMLTESFLAVLVLMALAAGLGIGIRDSNNVLLTGEAAFRNYYTDWNALNSIKANLDAFITGTSNLFAAVGVPILYGKSIVAVFIVSFAGTTLDSAARIQRLSLQEIFKNKDGKVIKPIDNRFVATFIIIAAAAAMSFIKPGGKGAMLLWPLFGSLNQLLAGLALGIVTIYLFLKKKNILYTLIPMVFIMFVTIWAMVENLLKFIKTGEIMLSILSILILLLTSCLIVSGIHAFSRGGVFNRSKH